MAPFYLRARLQSRKTGKKGTKGGRMKNMQKKIERVKAVMEQISEEQRNIREGQRQVREKLEWIETECDELKRETRLIVRQTARTQIKLALMFRIFEASQQSDHLTVAHLTHLLRKIVEKENEERQASSDS